MITAVQEMSRETLETWAAVGLAITVSLTMMLATYALVYAAWKAHTVWKRRVHRHCEPKES